MEPCTIVPEQAQCRASSETPGYTRMPRPVLGLRAAHDEEFFRKGVQWRERELEKDQRAALAQGYCLRCKFRPCECSYRERGSIFDPAEGVRRRS